jgi:hypothetical protein
VIHRSALLGFAALAGIATPALAHHSFAMFDREHKKQLSGTVKEVQWTNPHVWIQINVPNEKGVVEEWGVEFTSVNFMTRRGWNKDTVKAGDKIVLTISPLKDGSHGGGFREVVSVNGKPLELEPE